MSSVNLGWLFYKDYYRAIGDWSNIEAYKKDISKKVDELIEKSITIEQVEPLGNIHFKATTTYPGLLLGSGYNHKLPSVEGQAILGFDFDYTSGLPIIRGSSIKGVLRGAFKHQDYIKELLNQDVDIESLEEEIFENGDIFFDAVIVSGGQILGDDYLAPHKDDPLKNPIPLRFIKIMPNVTFRFDFELRDGVVTKEDKAILFGEILHDLGIGAKTNVGYGKFNDKLTKDNLTKQLQENKEAKEIAEQKIFEERKAKEREEKLAKLSPLDALVEQIKDISDNREIFELLNSSNLTDSEKQNIKKSIFDKIGAKPTKPKPAKRKWAIEIYKFFGE